VQQLPTGNAAGLSRFIYGKAASLTRDDALLILIASGVVTLVVMILFKEFKLLCFDAEFARTQGWPVVGLDLMLMGLVVAVTVIGLQAVGLLLVVALLIVPPAAARFWTHRLDVTVLLAGFVGAASGFVGAALSALVPKLPAGAVIVLAAVGCFGLSFAFGIRRGVVVRWFQDRAVARRVARQHLLRGLYEWCEGRTVETRRDPITMLEQPVPLRELAQASHWSDAVLRRLVRRGQNEGLISIDASGRFVHLSPQGKLEARTVTRNHRLWETYLLHYADVAPQHIHHNADRIEHVVEPDVVNELEELMAGRAAEGLVPADPERSSTMPREASAP
jgi:manganese/zinc/iron transport system permease protein